jgi:hypothetical protein
MAATASDPCIIMNIKGVTRQVTGFRRPAWKLNSLEVSELRLQNSAAGCATKKMLKMKGALDDLLKTKGQKKCSG